MLPVSSLNEMLHESNCSSSKRLKISEASYFIINSRSSSIGKLPVLLMLSALKMRQISDPFLISKPSLVKHKKYVSNVNLELNAQGEINYLLKSWCRYVFGKMNCCSNIC